MDEKQLPGELEKTIVSARQQIEALQKELDQFSRELDRRLKLLRVMVVMYVVVWLFLVYLAVTQGLAVQP